MTQSKIWRIGEEKEVPDTAICPRCRKRPINPSALSRHDDETLICGDCGSEEGWLNQIGNDRDAVTDEMMEREKRIRLKPSRRWFTYWPDSRRPLWLEQILLHGDPSQSKH